MNTNIEQNKEFLKIIEDTYVFLGGTCNGSTWRERLIPLLNVTYFNPVVENWDAAAIQRENFAKLNADANLFVITPLQKGFYSLAEMAVLAADTLIDPSMKLIVVFLDEDNGVQWDNHQKASNAAIQQLLSKYPLVEFYPTLEEVAAVLNNFLCSKKIEKQQNGS